MFLGEERREEKKRVSFVVLFFLISLSSFPSHFLFSLSLSKLKKKKKKKKLTLSTSYW